MRSFNKWVLCIEMFQQVGVVYRDVTVGDVCSDFGGVLFFWSVAEWK